MLLIVKLFEKILIKLSYLNKRFKQVFQKIDLYSENYRACNLGKLFKCVKKRFRQLKKIGWFGKNYRFFHRIFNLGKREVFKETLQTTKKKIDLFGKNYRFFHRIFNLGKLEMFKETPKQLKKSAYEAKAIDFFIEFLIYGIFFTTSKLFY